MVPHVPPPATLTRLLDEAPGDAVALVFGDRRITFGELRDEAARIAGGLDALGIHRGDVVAIWLASSPRWLAIALGCARIGALVLGLNTRFRAAELADLLFRAEAKALVLSSDQPSGGAAAILEDCDPAALDRLGAIVDCGPGVASLAGRKVVAYEALAATAPVGHDRGWPESPFVAFTTSGTTSRPKLVLHTQRSIITHALDVARGFDYFAAGTVLLHGLPLAGTFGLAHLMAAFAAAQPSVLLESFDPEAASAAIVRHHVTDFNASDEMIDRLLAAAPGDEPFPTLRGVGWGNFNPALADLPERAARRGVRLFGLYGSSEAQALYARRPLGQEFPDRAVPGGTPVAPLAAARIRHPETGRTMPDGESGELELMGPSLFERYLGDVVATRKAFAEDGYFRTGDLAHKAPDGSFVFEGRMGDVLRLGGYLVNPAEIEAHLETHPSVQVAQVVGVTIGSAPRAAAFVIMRPGAIFDEPALRDHCGGLARFKVPVAFWPVDIFPTTQSPNGVKVQKSKLRELAQQRLGGGG